ncbi:MAG: hypothetical protein L0Z53_27065 [Acidobacteriales bacterium]|nr:hypothetical protein [Terriglobales bacterium]
MGNLIRMDRNHGGLVERRPLTVCWSAVVLSYTTGSDTYTSYSECVPFWE